jgi:hypothetical protein
MTVHALVSELAGASVRMQRPWVALRRLRAASAGVLGVMDGDQRPLNHYPLHQVGPPGGPWTSQPNTLAQLR